MTRVGIVSALAAEARSLGPACAETAGVRRLGDGMLLAVSGIGCSAAAAAARALASSGATALASFGMAGALDPALACAAVVLPAEIALSDGTRLPTSAPWREQIRVAVAPMGAACGGTLLTRGQPIGSSKEKAALWRDTGAVAVDMESAAVAQVAATRALPFVALRVIVDVASDELPAAVLAVSRGGTISLWRLLAGLARMPADVGPLLRLSGRYRRARRVMDQLARPASPARRALGIGAEAPAP